MENLSDTNFVKVEYDRIQATDTFGDSPRFGHPSDFGLIFSDSRDDQTDYARGLIFGGAFILVAFLIWSITLVVWKCLGERKVGFLSGAPFSQSPNGGSKRLYRIRLAFVTAAILYIAFGFLLYAMGSIPLQDTENTIDNANQDVGQILQECNAISTHLRSLGETGDDLRQELITFLSSPFCPSYPELQDETGYNFEEIRQDILTKLNDLDDFIDADLFDLLDGIGDAQKTVNEVDDALDDSNSVLSSLVICIVFIALATLMLWAVLFSWFEISSPGFTRFINWVGLPLFIFLTVVAYLICSGTMVAAVANADFCSGGKEKTPDVSVLSILDNSGFTRDEITYEAIRYYATQCDAQDPWDFIREFRTDLEDAVTSVDELQSALKDVSASRLDFVCGRQFSPLQALLSLADENLHALKQNTGKALQVLACERVAPIYSGSVYTGVCDYSMKGFTWIVASTLIISFSGMVMLTLRSVLWDVKEPKAVDDENNSDGELVDEQSPRHEEEEVAEKDESEE